MEAPITANGTRVAEPTSPTRGRPPTADAKTDAERKKAQRDRLKARGLKEVKCFLSAEHLAYLRVLREVHGVTIADAVALAVTAVMRGELPTQSPTESPRQQSLILLP